MFMPMSTTTSIDFFHSTIGKSLAVKGLSWINNFYIIFMLNYV